MRCRILVGVLLGIFFAGATAANGTTLKAGDSLTYEYTLAQIEPVSSDLPADVAKAMKPSTGRSTFTFSVTIDRMDENGSAHAIISPHYNIHIPGWNFVDFEGSVLPDGQIVPKYDLSVLKDSGLSATSTKVTHGYRPRTSEEQINFSAYSFNRRLLFFNDVAIGAGKRKTFKDGDAWRIVISDKNDEKIDFSYVKADSYRGHDVVVLALTAVRITDKGPSPVKGTAYYDPQLGLLIGLHYEGDDDTPQGVRAQTIDINLQQ